MNDLFHETYGQLLKLYARAPRSFLFDIRPEGVWVYMSNKRARQILKMTWRGQVLSAGRGRSAKTLTKLARKMLRIIHKALPADQLEEFSWNYCGGGPPTVLQCFDEEDYHGAWDEECADTGELVLPGDSTGELCGEDSAPACAGASHDRDLPCWRPLYNGHLPVEVIYERKPVEQMRFLMNVPDVSETYFGDRVVYKRESERLKIVLERNDDRQPDARRWHVSITTFGRQTCSPAARAWYYGFGEGASPKWALLFAIRDLRKTVHKHGHSGMTLEKLGMREILNQCFKLPKELR